jgi:hypothetical protein
LRWPGELFGQPAGDAVAGAEPVHQHAHLDVALGGADQGLGHGLRGRVLGVDIGLVQDFLPCRIDRGQQCREIVAAAFE